MTQINNKDRILSIHLSIHTCRTFVKQKIKLFKYLIIENSEECSSNLMRKN